MLEKRKFLNLNIYAGMIRHEIETELENITDEKFKKVLKELVFEFEFFEYGLRKIYSGFRKYEKLRKKANDN